MRGDKKVILTLVVLLLGCFSCEKELDREAYVQYVTNPENGLRKDQELGDMEVSVIYEPVDYIIEREFPLDEDLSKVDQRKQELNSFEHFQFRLKLKNGGNILAFKENVKNNQQSRINHFSFSSASDFCLVSGKDTSFCQMVHFSRNFNLSPTIDLSLAFEKIDGNEDLQFVYTDSQFDLGRVKFLFERDDLEDVPSLKI